MTDLSEGHGELALPHAESVVSVVWKRCWWWCVSYHDLGFFGIEGKVGEIAPFNVAILTYSE